MRLLGSEHGHLDQPAAMPAQRGILASGGHDNPPGPGGRRPQSPHVTWALHVVEDHQPPRRRAGQPLQQSHDALFRIRVVDAGQVGGQAGVAGHDRLPRPGRHPDDQLDGTGGPLAFGVVDGDLGFAHTTQPGHHAGIGSRVRGQHGGVTLIQDLGQQIRSASGLKRRCPRRRRAEPVRQRDHPAARLVDVYPAADIPGLHDGAEYITDRLAGRIPTRIVALAAHRTSIAPRPKGSVGSTRAHVTGAGKAGPRTSQAIRLTWADARSLIAEAEFSCPCQDSNLEPARSERAASTSWATGAWH